MRVRPFSAVSTAGTRAGGRVHGAGLTRAIRGLPWAALCVASGLPGLASAEPSSDTALADAPLRIVVIGAPQPQPELQTPASVGVIDSSELHAAQPQIDLAETLGRLPGIDVRDRQNDAQDLQIQSRGYGARATFGVRGLQIRADGIPLTAPDGQGQTSNLLISSLDRIEVLRGPMAYQYGNASGGVVSATTAAPPADGEIGMSVGAGSNATWRESLHAGDQLLDGRLGARVDLAHIRSDGYRDHSGSQRNLAALNTRYTLANGDRLRLIASRLWNSSAQDPQGLTRDQYETDPRQASSVAATYNTRKRVDDWRAGIGYDGSLSSASDWTAIVYADARNIEQFLSIPPFVQTPPTQSGAVIDLARDGYGAEAGFTHRFASWSLKAGLQYQRTDEQRRGYENFVGATLGVKGALRRDEDNRIDNFDQYLFAEYPFARRWTLQAAVRHSHVRFESTDHYITAGNPDDSGSADFDSTLPALSLAFAPSAQQTAYVSVGAGYETPTFNELSYRSDGSSGLNLSLDAARSRSVELGWKHAVRGRGLFSVAVFDIGGRDEIVPAVNANGRASYQNAGTTRRRGAELGLSVPLPYALAWSLSADFLDARFTDAYQYVSKGSTVVVRAGNRIPGVARNSLYSELAWRRDRPGWAVTLDARYSDRVWVDDINSDAAEKYVVANASLAYQWRRNGRRANCFVRVDNLFDARYAGSVIVNDGNGRFFEPAPERSVFAGVEIGLGGAGG